MKAWNQTRPVGTAMKAVMLAGACASWLAVATTATASTFNIAPIRANLGAARHTEVLTLANAEDAPVVVQVRVVRWSQSGGEESLEDTRDLLATPPVLQIGPKSEQIVRVALRQPPDASKELSYRLVFQEVPQAPSKDFVGLRVALRLSVPVFIAPSGAKPAADMAWESRWLEDGKLEIAATNRGNAHLQITDFEVQLPGGVPVRGLTSKYVLPGSRMSWVLSPPADVPRDGSIKIHGHSDQGEFSADVVRSGL
jgi:fimbrial chaperone protein